MNLREIVHQLKLCRYECEGGPLENNVAFIELERFTQTGIVGETDGQTDTRQVLIPMREYDALLKVAEAAEELVFDSVLDRCFENYYDAVVDESSGEQHSEVNGPFLADLQQRVTELQRLEAMSDAEGVDRETVPGSSDSTR